MAAEIGHRVSGVWKLTDKCFVKASGSWKAANAVYVKSAGVWKKTFEGVVTLTLSGTQTNVNAFTAAGSPTSPVNLVIINNGTIRSTSTANAALTISGFPVGSTIRLINNGVIEGKGGTGGNGGKNWNGVVQPTAGAAGGPAIEIGQNTTIENYGSILGGGGGGGGGGAGTYVVKNPSYYGGGGGGGGRGNDSSNSSGGSYLTTGVNGSSGSAGNSSAAGSGGGGAGSYGGDGANGGSWGAAGSTGQSGQANTANQAGAVGGAAGRAVKLNGYTATLAALGTIAGAYT